MGACLGRLDPATDRLTFWNFPRPGLRPVNAGVTGDRPHNPLNIWFTYMGSGSSSRVFRLHRPSGVFFEYRPVMAFPRRVACDDAGNAWVSDWGGKVSRIRHDADCGTTAFPGKRVTLKRTTRRVKSITRRVQPVVHSVPSTDERVTRARANCYLDYPLPYPANGIQVTGGKAGVRPTVYFTEGLGNIIGRLKP